MTVALIELGRTVRSRVSRELGGVPVVFGKVGVLGGCHCWRHGLNKKCSPALTEPRLVNNSMERAHYIQERSLPELKDFLEKKIFSKVAQTSSSFRIQVGLSFLP